MMTLAVALQPRYAVWPRIVLVFMRSLQLLPPTAHTPLFVSSPTIRSRTATLSNSTGLYLTLPVGPCLPTTQPMGGPLDTSGVGLAPRGNVRGQSRVRRRCRTRSSSLPNMHNHHCRVCGCVCAAQGAGPGGSRCCVEAAAAVARASAGPRCAVAHPDSADIVE